QKTDGTGICPQGYRVPTVAEWRAELDASSQDMSNSTLKLPLAGFRDGRTGKVNRTTSSTNNPNAVGYYLASDSSSQKLVKFLFLDQNRRGKIETKGRAYGYSVRCIEAQNGEKAPGAAPSDDHSNSKDEATPINPNSITPGSIETTGDVDWFKIVIPSRGTLVVKTTGTIDTAGELYDASGRHRIAYDDDGGADRNFKITQTVTAGTYYVEVRHRASGTGIYALSTIFTSAPASTPTTPVSDDYGNTASTARTISPTSIISGNIETAGDIDWFKIVIPHAGRLVVAISSPTGINGSLYNVSNVPIASEDSSGSSISQSITAGTYYVKVRHHSPTGTGIYALSTRFTASIPVSDDYGNTRNTAATIGTTSTTLGDIETAGDVDYFEINITSAGTLVVNTTGSTDTVGILYNASGTQIGYDNNSGTDTNFKISKKVVAGTYYVRVSASSSGNYGLVYHVTADDHGDDKSTATSITPTSTTPGNIETAGDEDWFKIVIPSGSTGTLVVETTGSTDTNGILYNASGAELKTNDNNGSGNNFKISQTVTAGTYYVKVKHSSATGTGNYNLATKF
ncbi:MAG: pre-peptidase C-terminal domain-containing protein, partial [Sulfurovum sp.]|nr:pre-peptidase C-terminal domain-containing protein [Sulfurovum sp.]